MTRQPAVGRGFRTRKLSNKQNLQIVRENQIDAAEDDGQRNIPQIETGVERGEEIVRYSPLGCLFLARATAPAPRRLPRCMAEPALVWALGAGADCIYLGLSLGLR